MQRQKPVGGWHWDEWGCEFAGTALLLAFGLSAVLFDFGPHSPVVAHLHHPVIRRMLTGAVFAGAGGFIAISPLGRLSGAHLNPAVTLAFWSRGKVHISDAVGYICAQLLGGLVGAGLVRVLWGRTARALSDGATTPSHGLSDLGAVAVEAGMTFVLVTVILLLTGHVSLARWTPVAVTAVVVAFVAIFAPYTGTSLNPARSLGPAVFGGQLSSFWIYVVGPLAGALVASRTYRGETVTAKVFHDEHYRSTMASALPIAED